MIVDDSSFTRRILKDILTKGGFEVVAEASGGVDALEKYKELKPDLVTMDIIMPDVDGIEVVKSIIDTNPWAKIVMCTAMGQEHLIKKAMQAGAKAYIIKPFQPMKVLGVIKDVIGRTRYLELFIKEGKQHLEVLNKQLPVLMERPNDLELPKELYTRAYQLKKMAVTMKNDYIDDLTSDMEDDLKKLYQGQVDFIVDLISQVEDSLKKLYQGQIQITKEVGDMLFNTLSHNLNTLDSLFADITKGKNVS